MPIVCCGIYSFRMPLHVYIYALNQLSMIITDHITNNMFCKENVITTVSRYIGYEIFIQLIKSSIHVNSTASKRDR